MRMWMWVVSLRYSFFVLFFFSFPLYPFLLINKIRLLLWLLSQNVLKSLFLRIDPKPILIQSNITLPHSLLRYLPTLLPFLPSQLPLPSLKMSFSFTPLSLSLFSSQVRRARRKPGTGSLRSSTNRWPTTSPSWRGILRRCPVSSPDCEDDP